MDKKFLSENSITFAKVDKERVPQKTANYPLFVDKGGGGSAKVDKQWRGGRGVVVGVVGGMGAI